MTGLGKFYGVGVGTGDPEHLTLKAIHTIRSVSVICAPRVVGSQESFVLSIVQEFIDDRRQEILLARLPQTSDSNELIEALEESIEQIRERLLGENDVAFLTLGDPMIYSLYPYFRERLFQKLPQLESSVVPGISSVSLSAARTGIELASGSERLAIVPLASNMQHIETLLISFDVVVFLKVNRDFDDFVALLTRMGIENSAVLISQCGTQHETIVRSITSLRGSQLDYLSLVIVAKRSKISQNIGWW